MITVNPLDVLNQRYLSWMPPHFAKTKISEKWFDEERVKDWIQYKLKGRFAIQAQPNINDKDAVQTATFVGFEDEKELTYFMLACPYLRS